MIKVELTDVWGFEHAVRGMRNPMNSWDRGDSHYSMDRTRFIIGKDDLKLMQKLYKAGTEHRKFMRQIFISMDITAPLYWWKEFDTYKVGTTANSCSTMHKIHSKEFSPDDFSFENLVNTHVGIGAVQDILSALNHFREMYLRTKSKQYWWQMIQVLPTSYNQKRTVTMNYENAVTIIRQRSGHKLDEWKELINELSKLPYMQEITGGGV